MGAESPQRLAIFENLLLKQMQFRHISAKIQPKNLKQHFDFFWGGGGWGTSSLAPLWLLPRCNVSIDNKLTNYTYTIIKMLC